MTLKDILKRLIGDIEPTGESHIDIVRFKNLKVMCSLIEDLLYDVKYISTHNKNRQEFSMKQMGQHADKFVTDIVDEFSQTKELREELEAMKAEKDGLIEAVKLLMPITRDQFGDYLDFSQHPVIKKIIPLLK